MPLALHINAGESLLAREYFELSFVDFHEDRTCKFILKSFRSVPYTIAGLAGSIRGGIAIANEPIDFEATLGSVIRVGESKVTVWKAKGPSVKLSIEAPKSISFCRPSQHGSSPPEGYKETVVSE